MGESTPNSGTTALEPWQWPEAVWREHVEKVRAGRPLTPPWPRGLRVAVAISFDADHETAPLRSNETSPGRLAQGEYGARVGVPRILTLLDEYRIPASFYMPAVSALLHPQEARAYVAAGHEIGVHGWIHERNTALDYATERMLIERSARTLEQITGVAPVGIRTPSWDFSDSTLQVIQDLGMLYDSSLMADDEPYELLQENQPTGIVEIPVDWIRDDAPYFSMSRYEAIRPYTPPRAVLQVWKDEFDAAYASGGTFQLTLHPHVIGHRSRLVILRELLEHIQAHTGVWFATHKDLALHVLGATETLRPGGTE